MFENKDTKPNNSKLNIADKKINEREILRSQNFKTYFIEAKIWTSNRRQWYRQSKHLYLKTGFATTRGCQVEKKKSMKTCWGGKQKDKNIKRVTTTYTNKL